MPIARFQMPDGKIGRFEVPEGTTPEQAHALIQQSQTTSQEQPKQEPSSILSDIGRGFTQGTKDLGAGLLRGAGSIGSTLLAPVDMAARGLGVQNEYIGRTDRRQAMEEALKGMGANPESISYQGGKITGEVAGTAGMGGSLAGALKAAPMASKVSPALIEAIRTGGMSSGGIGGVTGGAARIAGGAATGAASAGLSDPSSFGAGALVGGAIPAVGMLATGVKNIGKAVIDPFYEAGQRRVRGGAMNRAAGGDEETAINNLLNAQELVPGSMPTAGEAANNSGIAALQRSATSVDPIAMRQLEMRQAAQNEARIGALQGLSPDIAPLKAARKNATDYLYNQSANETLQITPEINKLLNRPSLQNALRRAQNLAQDTGVSFKSPVAPNIYDESLNKIPASIKGNDAHLIKMALDDLSNSSAATGITGNELRAVNANKSEYLSEIEKQLPIYGQARTKYAELSKPITQSEIAQEISNKSINRFGNMTPAAYDRALSDVTTQRVSGQKSATLENTMTAKQLQDLNNIRADLLRSEYAQTAGKGSGSDTAQKMAMNNLMSRMGIQLNGNVGPVRGVLGDIAGRTVNFAYKNADQKMAKQLAEDLMNPKQAAEVMKAARESNIPTSALVEYLRQGVYKTAPVLSAQ